MKIDWLSLLRDAQYKAVATETVCLCWADEAVDGEVLRLGAVNGVAHSNGHTGQVRILYSQNVVGKL